MTLKNKNKSKDKINVQCKVNYPTLCQQRAEGWGTRPPTVLVTLGRIGITEWIGVLRLRRRWRARFAQDDT
jgi:hypothetical protein